MQPLNTMTRQQLRDLINQAANQLAHMGETITITYTPHLATWSPFDTIPTPAEKP